MKNLLLRISLKANAQAHHKTRMIPKNLQHDIFENDDKHRLVYLGAFAEAEEGFHKAEIAEKILKI